MVISVNDGQGLVGNTFSLITQVSPIPTNATCATARPLTLGTPLAGESPVGGGAPPSACLPWSPPAGTAQATWYSLTVPPATAVGVAVSGSLGLSLSALDACAATSCSGYSNAPGGLSSLLLRNLGTTPRTMYLAVTDEAGQGGTFNLNTTSTPIAANSACATPTAVTVGTPIVNEQIGAGGAPVAVCLPGPGGIARHYAVPVPPNTAVTFAVSANGFDPFISVVDTCADTTCGATGNTYGPNESVLLQNTSATARTYLVSVVDLNNLGGTYSITTTATASSTCSTPTLLPLGTLAGSIVAGTAAPTACLPLSTGPTVYYSASVPPGESRVVRVNVTGTFFNPSLRVLDSCVAASCVASQDAVGPSETLSFSNTSTSTQTFIVAVGSASGTGSGTYSITLSRPAYAVGRMATACEDVSTAADVSFTVGQGAPAVFGDDLATASLPLPFGISFFGQPVTHASFATNGLMTMTNGAGPSAPTTSYGAPIPTPGAASNFIAGLWDDTNGNATTSSHLRMATIGTAPNRRFVVEWGNVGHYQSTSTGVGVERLTWQVHLLETSNVIEFHYCSAASNGGLTGFETGATAVIGLQDATGSDNSIGISADVAGSASTAQGYRLTPAP
jgi:hypothetical protein